METYARFKMRLIAKLRDIMPYYTKLYQIQLEANNLKLFETTVMQREITEKENENTAGNKSNTSTANSNESRNISGNSKNITESSNQNEVSFSDTPQGAISNVLTGKYLTNFTYTNDTVNSTDTNENTQAQTLVMNGNTAGTEESEGTRKKDNNKVEIWHGKEGSESYAAMMEKLKEVIWNINLMIYDECEELFMGVF